MPSEAVDSRRTRLECSRNVPNCSRVLILVSCFSIIVPITLCTRDVQKWLAAFPFPLHKLIKHGRLHSKVVEERLCVFYSELLHQSGIMSLQPTLLCQSWTGMRSCGSFPPISFPGLLHTRFKQILLEVSNLEQRNVVQRSILYNG